jgi:putative transposase
MYLFNDENFCNPGGFSSLRDVNNLKRLLETGDKRTRLVNILSYCLVPNHFHLLLEQLVNDGIPKFMHCLGMGYALYFNKRYDRTGRLYESTFKAILVERDAQFIHLPRYIHLNALDLTNLNWRDGKVDNWEEAEQFLDSYKWSSHLVYNGENQFLPVVERSILNELLPNSKSYRAFLKNWGARLIPGQFRL